MVGASRASLFYRAPVLQAYQDSPLRETLAVYYVMARSATQRIEAVLPLYLVPPSDPLKVLPSLLPGRSLDDRPLLVSHVWHWYDTCLPAYQLSPPLVTAICAGVRDLAVDCGAQAFGFINVAENGPLARLLPASGLAVHRIDARYTLDLWPFRAVEDYLMALPRAARQDLRRQVRRAQSAGASITIGPPGAEMREVARLCQATAAKHGNPGWYEPELLSSFVARIGTFTRLVTIWMAGRPVAGSISFADGGRFHNWAAGSVPLGELPFSPYAVLLYETVRAALAEGCTLLEGGRRNDGWKERLGLHRQPLGGCFGPV